MPPHNAVRTAKFFGNNLNTDWMDTESWLSCCIRSCCPISLVINSKIEQNKLHASEPRKTAGLVLSLSSVGSVVPGHWPLNVSSFSVTLSRREKTSIILLRPMPDDFSRQRENSHRESFEMKSYLSRDIL